MLEWFYTLKKQKTPLKRKQRPLKIDFSYYVFNNTQQFSQKRQNKKIKEYLFENFKI